MFIQVTAVNNEKMYVDPAYVAMVGPLMDRGVAELARSVLYFEKLPPLPIKESRDSIKKRLEEYIELDTEGPEGAGDSNRSAYSGPEARLVVP